VRQDSAGDGIGGRPDLAGVAALADPLRRDLYGFVIAQVGGASRDDVAAATGVARHVVRSHLDRLVEEGLLDVEFRRPPGRGGPGAGRPAKIYRRASREFAVSVPARRYDLAASVLARAVRRSVDESIPIGEALHETATAQGRSMGEEAARRAGSRPARPVVVAAVRGVLDEHGYETRCEGGDLILGNCPFAALLGDGTELICTMNMDVIRGALDSCGKRHLTADFDVRPDRCCVRVSGLT
jgi:predicted ArsR family transcriptional regulator